MTNSYYNHGSYPVTGAPGASSALRGELDLITAGFTLLPTLSGNANKALVINAGAAAITVTTGTLALAGNFATTGAYNTTLVQGATTSLTLPLVSGTLATLAGTETLSNKTIAASTLSGTVSGGGNQINNVVIGTTTPLAGTFTTLTSTTALVTSATTDATSITTGALQSAGGLGVTKAIWVGGLANIAGAVTAAAGVSSTLTTDATSATTGSIVTAGGISTQKALWVGGLANIAGVATLGPGAVLNTPASMTATNITGTAAGLTAGNVTTNANLTGDVTSVGNATTLATVASAGSTGGSTAIPVITINAKGLTTGITTAAVIAPAGTLTGATLASNVLASSLTSLGTIATLTATAGTIATTPSGSTDIANKLYVDTVAQGLDAKASCIAATTADITLSGTQTVDGVVLIATDRVLVKNQTAPAENGLYLCASGAWTRTTDADTWDELRSAFVFIEKGTVYADTGWVCTIDSGGTLGTTAVTWAQFSGAGSYTASTGLTLTGTAFSLTAPVTVALGGTNATSAGITSFNNITGYTASGATGTTSTNLVFSASPTLTGTLTAAAGAFSSTLTSAANTITSASAAALAVGLNGATNSAFTVDSSTALQVAGLKITGAVTGGTVAVVATDSGSATNLTLNAKGTGTIGIGSVSTGAVTITPATTISGTLGVVGVATLGNGAILGIPASGTVTNLTGTASIDINGTVGATTPTTAAVTTLAASGDSAFTSTGALQIPASTTANRPVGVTGKIRYNTTLSTFEGYGSAWGSIGGGATGAGGDTVFQENQLIVTTSYTLSTGKSAMSVGPITINALVAVTVPSGYRWVVL